MDGTERAGAKWIFFSGPAKTDDDLAAADVPVPAWLRAYLTNAVPSELPAL